MASLTRAERLDAVIAKVAPKTFDEFKRTGAWPNTHPAPGTKRDDNGNPVLDANNNPLPARHSGAPYVFDTLVDGRRRVKVFGDDGDVVAGVGATIEEAVTSLESKLKVG